MRTLLKAAHLKPEARLGQAVVDFEQELSKEERQVLYGQRSHTLESPPTQRDVMRVLSQIDKTSGVVAGRRCFGPRFTGILTAVQQFAALGDVVLGGSQNLVACSVWTVLRTTLLAIASYSTYLDRISDLFMSIARSAPNIESLGFVFPQSKQLQSSLVEYHIVVVGICHHIWIFVKKSPLKRLGTSIFDTQLTNLQQELEKWAQAIQDHLHVLMAKLAVEEAKRRGDLDILATKGLGLIQHQSRQRKRFRLLERCSTFHYQTAWKQLRKKGTSSLTSSCKEYDDWILSSNSATIVFKGKVGSGKSVLLASITTDLSTRVFERPTPFAYFFCQHDIHESLQARTILGSLTRQLLSLIPDFDLDDKLVAGNALLDIEHLREILASVLPHDHDNFILVDGLDECDEGAEEQILDWLQSMQRALCLKVCLAYRLQSAQHHWQKLDNSAFVIMPDENPDIEAYINAELEARLESGKLTLGDAAIILEIQEALIKGAQGMFLWVTLQIDSLCAMATDEKIRNALENLPEDLPRTFSRILHRCRGQGRMEQRRLLELVTSAFRPLSTEELREAFSVIPGDIDWRPSILINDIDTVFALGGGLIVVDEEEQTVRTVHHSFDQFLMDHTSQREQDMSFTLDLAHQTMAETIITYLSYGVFETQVSTRVVPRMDANAAPVHILQSTVDQSTVRRIAIQLLKQKRQPTIDIGKTVAGAREPRILPRAAHFVFISYAKTHCTWHVVRAADLHQQIVKPLFRFLSKVEHVKKTETLQEVFLWAVRVQLRRLIVLLLSIDELHLPLNVDECVAALSCLTSDSKTAHAAHTLLQVKGLEIESRDEHRRTVLLLAVEFGLDAVVEVLLNGGACIEAADEDYRTALALAANRGFNTILKLLLAKSASVEHHDRFNYTPLMLASKSGHLRSVGTLLEHAANTETVSDYGFTALALAVEFDHYSTAELLLKKGAHTETQTAGSATVWSPLVIAATKNNRTVVSLLLKHKAYTEVCEPKDGRTRLQWAAKRLGLSGLRTIMSSGSSASTANRNVGFAASTPALCVGHENNVDDLVTTGHTRQYTKEVGKGRTPLVIAASSGFLHIVQVLVEAGADVNARSRDGWTAIMYAADTGSARLVELMLDKSQLELQNDLGRNVAMIAAAAGHASIVHRLLETDRISVDTRAVDGKTLFMIAIERGLMSVVKLLRDLDNDQFGAVSLAGCTAADYAVQYGHHDIADFLRSTGL